MKPVITNELKDPKLSCEDNLGNMTQGWSGIRRPKACVFGLGLIGGSWAGALHQNGWEVIAVEPEKASIEEALDRKWIQAGFTETPDFIDVDLVVLALPLHKLVRSLERLVGRIPNRTVVTDVGSLKMEICEESSIRTQGDSAYYYFVGGHPMTGSEQSGFKVSNPNLFRGYPYVLTPADDCPQDVLFKLEELLINFGAKVEFRQPKVHDEEVAMVSHIPHLLAVALTLATEDASEEGSSALALAGRSFREITRIVDSSPEMWKEIMIKNSSAILGGLNLWEQRINELRGHIQQGNGEPIAEAFRKAHTIRECINQ